MLTVGLRENLIIWDFHKQARYYFYNTWERCLFG